MGGDQCVHDPVADEPACIMAAEEHRLALQTTLMGEPARATSDDSEIWLEQVLAPLMENMRNLPVVAQSHACAESYPDVGTIVDGTWLLVGRLGQGAFGQVFEAKHLSLGRTDAIKFLHPRYGADPVMRCRFFQEARATAKFCGNNIVRIYDHGEHAGLPFLVMERLDGETLEQLLEREGCVSISSFVEHADDILQAMVEVHDRGVVHRDIKPANVFVLSERRGIKLLDFGLAMTSVRLTDPGTFMGTLCYAAPELLGHHPAEASHSSDIYAVGAVLYTMLTGRPPFVPRRGEYPAAFIERIREEVPPAPCTLRPDLPVELSELVMRVLDRDPRRRPQDAHCFWEALMVITGRMRLPQTIDVGCVSAPLPISLESDEIPTEPRGQACMEPGQTQPAMPVLAVARRPCGRPKTEPAAPVVGVPGRAGHPWPAQPINAQAPRRSLAPELRGGGPFVPVRVFIVGPVGQLLPSFTMPRVDPVSAFAVMMVLIVGALMALCGGLVLGASVASALIGG